MEISKQDKIKLIHFLNFVCDYEASKPIEEMDEELIKSCVKVLLDLQDKHVKHSPEFIDEQVRKIFRKEETEITEPETVKTNKKQINRKRYGLLLRVLQFLWHCSVLFHSVLKEVLLMSSRISLAHMNSFLLVRKLMLVRRRT